uniref:Retrotransposon protein, unclassified n=1 Tax=Solanum tuberosum TaxID=4113 RepID=M1E172_SOLTU
MASAPTDDRFRPPDPTTGMNMHTTIQESTSDSSYNSSQREVHTALAEQELDITRTNISKEDLRQFHDTRIPATTAENVRESSQKCHQNRSVYEVIRAELVTGVCTTGRGGHPTEVSGKFHGGITDSDNSGESTGVLVNLPQKEDMQSLSQTQNTHMAGKEKVQELGQSSSSNLDVFVKKQGKDTGTIPIDNSRSSVIPAYNSDTELHRTENHPSKVWVAKEHDHSTAIRQGQSNQGKAVPGIDSMLPVPKPLETVIVVEEAVGGGSMRGGELTHARHEEVDFDHSGDSKAPDIPITTHQKTGTQPVTDTGQQHGRFNNKSGDRLSKKKREALKRNGNRVLVRIQMIQLQTIFFAMNPSSVEGPDCIGGKFYQSCWSSIKEDLLAAVQYFFCGKIMPKFMTHSCLVLLPKTEQLTRFRDLRPINLSNFTNKIIS